MIIFVRVACVQQFLLRGGGNCTHAIISVLVKKKKHQSNFHCPKSRNYRGKIFFLLWARQIEFKLEGVQVFSFADRSSMT